MFLFLFPFHCSRLNYTLVVRTPLTTQHRHHPHSPKNSLFSKQFREFSYFDHPARGGRINKPGISSIVNTFPVDEDRIQCASVQWALCVVVCVATAKRKSTREGNGRPTRPHCCATFPAAATTTSLMMIRAGKKSEYVKLQANATPFASLSGSFQGRERRPIPFAFSSSLGSGKGGGKES